MTDEKQLTTYTAKTPGDVASCGEGGSNEACGSDIVPKSDGSAEYEKGEAFRAENNYSEAVKWFKLAADFGYTEAMLTLGHMYRSGTEIEKSFKAARDYYSKASAGGNLGGEFWLGVLHHKWNGPEKDLAAAAYHYTQSADQGDRYAAFLLGEMYFYGEGLKQDYAKAAHYLESVADLGVATTMLIKIYCYGTGNVGENYEKALLYVDIALKKTDHKPEVRAVVENQVSQCMFIIGTNKLMPDSYSETLKLYERIFALKHVDPFIKCATGKQFGDIYNFGRGVEKDFSKAAQGYEISSNADCNVHMETLIESKMWLGRMYLVGRGVQKDMGKAFELLEAAHKLESTQAADTLCSIYANGYGVARDLNKAIQYCEKGAEKASCEVNLGALYYLTKQYAKALPCLKKAFEDNKKVAAYMISLMYMDGEGIVRDFALARQWAEKSEDKELLFKTMDRTIPENLSKYPGAKSYSIKMNLDKVMIGGMIGLTHEEETNFFGKPIDGKDLIMDIY